jgi:8-oxo-dGTP pyrophosphatase MutT (NUDIX family)
MAALTRKESSAGGVVYKNSGGLIQVLLIARKQPQSTRAAGRKKIWCLPKGKIEKAETPQQAAEREISEETGVAGSMVRLLGDIYYQFISPLDKARVFKNVRFFLFEHKDGEIICQDSEVEDAGWFNVDEALKMMAYPSEKAIMQKAKRACQVKD